jgi:hypothetical protein
MKPRPAIYADILILGGGNKPRIGGHFAQPNLGLSYLLAARHVIEAGEAERRLAEVTLPAAYLQRHAMEVGLKNLLELVYGIHRDREWLDALRRDPNADRNPVESVPPKHHFSELRRLARQALKKIDFDLPDEIAGMTKKLAEAEVFDHTRFRYLTLTNGEESFPKPEILRVAENQDELEMLFEKHLHFHGFDKPRSGWNLATELAALGGGLFQQITGLVPLDRL